MRRWLFAALAIAATPLAVPAAVHCVTETPQDGCFLTIAAAIAAAAPAGDLIFVAPGEYAGPLFVDKSVDIVGSGIDVTVIRGNGPGNVIEYPSSGPAVTSVLAQMTITNGTRGIYTGRSNSIYVDHVRVAQNGGGQIGAGIFNDTSLLYVVSSVIEANPSANATHPSICNFSGTSGGGIAACNGTTIVVDSAIRGNFSFSQGGGMHILGGTVVLVNNTFSNNSVLSGPNGGALFVGNATAYLVFNTFAGNSSLLGTDAGGTIAVDDGSRGFGAANVFLYANLLQGDRACIGPITSYGYNLASDGTCTAFVQGGDGLFVDAQLGPYQQNGGATPTYAPAATSPAVDRIPAAGCTFPNDQRGVPRPQRGGCDSGAFELQ